MHKVRTDIWVRDYKIYIYVNPTGYHRRQNKDLRVPEPANRVVVLKESSPRLV